MNLEHETPMAWKPSPWTVNDVGGKAFFNKTEFGAQVRITPDEIEIRMGPSYAQLWGTVAETVVDMQNATIKANLAFAELGEIMREVVGRGWAIVPDEDTMRAAHDTLATGALRGSVYGKSPSNIVVDECRNMRNSGAPSVSKKQKHGVSLIRKMLHVLSVGRKAGIIEKSP